MSSVLNCFAEAEMLVKENNNDVVKRETNEQRSINSLIYISKDGTIYDHFVRFLTIKEAWKTYCYKTNCKHS